MTNDEALEHYQYRKVKTKDILVVNENIILDTVCYVHNKAVKLSDINVSKNIFIGEVVISPEPEGSQFAGMFKLSNVSKALTVIHKTVKVRRKQIEPSAWLTRLKRQNIHFTTDQYVIDDNKRFSYVDLETLKLYLTWVFAREEAVVSPPNAKPIKKIKKTTNKLESFMESTSVPTTEEEQTKLPETDNFPEDAVNEELPKENTSKDVDLRLEIFEIFELEIKLLEARLALKKAQQQI